MLAVSPQNIQSSGPQRTAFAGPDSRLGRIFTRATTRDDAGRHSDCSDPARLRAPPVTARDEEMRPSGTLQSPTTGSLEAMIVESDREEQLAQARRLPRNAVVNLPDVEPAPFGRAATEVARQQAPAINTRNAQAVAQGPTSTASQANVATTAQPKPAQVAEVKTQIDELPAFVPAPKSLVSDRSAEQLALVNSGVGGTQNASLTSMPKPIETSVARSGGPTANLNLTGGVAPFKLVRNACWPLS